MRVYFVLQLAPAQMRLAGEKDGALDLGAGEACLLLGESVDVVEAADEDEVGDLFDDLEWVGDPA